MTSSLFQAKELSFEYMLGRLRLQALKKVSIDIRRGEFVCLAGPSGSGKSTLLNVLGLIEPVQEGSVLLDGRELRAMSEKEKNRIRRAEVGFIFQNFHLIQVLRADENVEYFLTRQGVPKAERLERVKWALDAVGLWEHRMKKPLEMSGGQRQRVAIARALAKKPKVIIADEPTASLDQKTGHDIMSLMMKLTKERDTTVVVASHDPMVLEFAERTVRLRDGEIV